MISLPRSFTSAAIALVLLTTSLLLLPAGPGSAVQPGAGPFLGHPVAPGGRASALAPTTGTSAAHPAAAPVLTLTGSSPSAVALSWTAATGLVVFSNYTLFESTVGAGGPWQFVWATTTNTATTWSTGTLTPGVEVWWQVTEFELLGSQASNVVADPQPASAALNFTLPSGSSAAFNWSNNATYGGSLAFVSYGLYEEAGGGAPSLVASIPTAGTRTFTATGLSGGTGYTFYVNTTDCYAGCGGATPSDAVTESNPVTFGVAVPLAASVSDVRSIVDVGQPDLFNCNPSGGAPPYTFAWDFGNGTLVPGTESESRSFSAAGSPTVHCDVTDSAHTVATAATTVTVNPTPTLAVTGSAVDVGEAAVFSCVPSGGTPTFTLAWTFGDGATGSGSPATHTYAAPGTERVTCAATDATTTTVDYSISTSVSPRLSVVARTSATAAAPGTSLTLSSVVTNGSGTVASYAWSFGDGSHAGTAAVSHAYAANGTFNATVVVTDSNGATNRSSVVLRISPISARFSTIPSSGSTSDTIAFGANASGGAGGPYNYTWTYGDGTTGFGAAVDHRYHSVGTFHVSLVVTDRLGATNTSGESPLSIAAPPPPPPLVPLWALLALLLLILLVVGFFVYREVRRRRSAALRSAAPWAPPTDPSRTLRGRKNCPTCGASNLPIRETCENCGADLPRRSLTN